MKLQVASQMPKIVDSVATDGALINLSGQIAMKDIVLFKCRFTLSLKRAESAVEQEFSLARSCRLNSRS